MSVPSGAVPGSDWKALGAAAGQGGLRMDAGVAERASARCLELAQRVTEHWRAVHVMAPAPLPMGDCATGRALAATVHDKLVADENSVAKLLYEQTVILTAMSEAFRAAGRAVAGQEQEAAAALVAAGQALDR